MPPRNKSKGKGGRSKDDNASPDQEQLAAKGSEQAFAPELSVSDWRLWVDQEETEIFIAGLVDECVETALDAWYVRHLDRAAVPYIWEWYKANMLELLRLDDLSADPGEDPLKDPSWEPDPEPAPTPIDSWASAAVSFVSREELRRLEAENLAVQGSPLQFDQSRPLEPLVTDPTLLARVQSALSLAQEKRSSKVSSESFTNSTPSDLATCVDSCDWWLWGQSRRLDRQPASGGTSSAEEAAQRIAAADAELLQGDAEMERAYREYIHWVELAQSDDESTDSPPEEVGERATSIMYQPGARMDYEGDDIWLRRAMEPEAEEEEPEPEPEPEREPEEPARPPTPSTLVSECRSCCAVAGTGSGDTSSRHTQEPPAAPRLRPLRLSRCSGLLARSEHESEGSGEGVTVQEEAPPPPPPKGRRRGAATLGRAADPGHYEQVDIDCRVTEYEKPPKKGRDRMSSGRAGKRGQQPAKR